MHARSWLSPLGAIVVGAALVACTTGFDVGTPYRTRPISTTDGTSPDDDLEPDDHGTQSSEDETDEEDVDAAASTIVGPTDDGGSGTTPSKTTAFTGAPAYVAASGPVTRKAAHNFAANTPTTNPAGRPCLQCHGAAGPAPRFAFGGTVYKDAIGTPAPQVEVRVVGADGQARTAFTNADGNFFFLAASGAVSFPALAGARDSDSTELMTTATANGNCNACHRAGGTTTPLVVQ
jgi:cytochrome c553